MQDMEGLTLDLNESSQICEQSLLVRSKPMRSRTWFQKWKRDSWTSLLYGRILKHSHSSSFVEKWTSSLEASLVNRSQLRDVEEEMKILDISSHISREESLFSDLPLFSLRTSKESSPQSSEKDGAIEKERPFSSMFSESWKGWIIKRRQEYLARERSVLHIKEKESLSWPTPIKEDYKRREPNSRQQGLPNIVLNGPQEEEKSKKIGSLCELYPTPMLGGHEGGSIKYYQRRREIGKQIDLHGQITLDQKVYNGQLNPRWVETLMGVPIGWTIATCANPYVIERMNSDSLGMESSPRQLKEPSESFGINWATPNVRDHKGCQTEGFLDRGYGYQLPDHVREESLIHSRKFQELDSCIIGSCKNDQPVYSYTKLIEYFCQSMDVMEAIDHINFNLLSGMETQDYSIEEDWE